MKKFMLGIAALTVALIGFGSLTASTTQATASAVNVINNHVGAALAGITPAQFDTAMATAAGRAPLAASFAAMEAASAGQISADMPNAGQDWVIVQTNDSATTIVANGRGLVCAPLCDNVATQTPDVTDKMVLWKVTGVGTFPGGPVTVTQTSTSLDSAALTAVGTAHDMQLTVDGTPAKTTIQEAAAACAVTTSPTKPSVALANVTYTDINGVALVGYNPLLSSSSAAHMLVGNAAGTGAAASIAAGTVGSLYTMANADKSVSAQDTICGVAAGTATLSAVSNALNTPAEVPGLASPFTVTRTLAITITGVPAAIALTASPAMIACDGTATSKVTAKVTDSAGNNVVDNTVVNFSVVALGTSNPINTKTAAGEASSTVTPLSGGTAGVTVIVTAGDVQTSIRVDCSLPIPTVAPAPSATPKGGTGTIGGPDTGNGGYLGQNGSTGFPMWTLIALALGSVALVGGSVVARRSSK